MVNFDRIYFGINQKNEIFVGAGKRIKSGLIKWEQKSRDKTVEVVNVVGQMMRNKMLEQDGKNYFGYDLGRIGKLVLVRPGYTFEVMKGTAARPIQFD